MKAIIYILILIVLVGHASATVITVGENNADFTSIQDAIRSANDFDIISVEDGVYLENLFVNKSLTLKVANENSPSVVIYSENSSDYILHIVASNTSISGFNLTGSIQGKHTSGIYLDNISYCQISGNSISNTQDGILLLSSHENEIENNSLFSNNLHGINLSRSNNNIITQNEIYSNKYGIIVQSSVNNTIYNNNASFNENYGIALFKTDFSVVKENIAINNKHGICLTSSFNNEIENNIVTNNLLNGAVLWKSEENILKNNNFSFNRDSGMLFVSQNRKNEILYNEVSHNNKYGIFLNSDENNTIENNILTKNEIGIQSDDFSKNRISANTIDNRLSFKKLLYIFLILTLIVFACHLKKKSLLLKSLTILFILINLVCLAMITWYFMFESGMQENVEVNNLQWMTSSSSDNHTRGIVSMNIIYNGRDFYPQKLEKTLPAEIRISSISATSTLGGYSLLYKEPLTLEYMEPYSYSHDLDLKNTNQYLLVEVYTNYYYEYPNPVYGDSSWEQIGMAVTDVNWSGS